MIEVISSTYQINRVQKNRNDYLKAKVQVVWHIFPDLQMIHVYTGKQMVICKGKDLCSASKVIKGFKLSVDEVFKKI